MNTVFAIIREGMDGKRCSGVYPTREEAEQMAKFLNSQNSGRPSQYAVSFSVLEMDKEESKNLY